MLNSRTPVHESPKILGEVSCSAAAAVAEQTKGLFPTGINKVSRCHYSPLSHTGNGTPKPPGNSGVRRYAAELHWNSIPLNRRYPATVDLLFHRGEPCVCQPLIAALAADSAHLMGCQMLSRSPGLIPCHLFLLAALKIPQPV